MSFLQRQTTRITGIEHEDGDRRKGITGRKSTGNVPKAKKPRSRPPTSLRDHLPFPNSSLPPASGPYSVGSMEIEVPVENPRPISHIKRDGRHLLRLETVLFTLYYPAAFGSGSGFAPGGEKKWSRETWLPRPRLETAKGYAKFAGIPNWSGVGFFGATAMLTKLRAFRNSPPATHWPPEGNSKKRGYKVKNEQGLAPEGINRDPIFPLMMFSHGLGGSRTAYSSLCTEFASYGFVVCAVEHRDGSGPRTFVNHPKSSRPRQDSRQDTETDLTNGNNRAELKKEHDQTYQMGYTDEELEKGYHHVDYIFPKGNPMDTAPNNEHGVDRELRNAQIELRLCELEEAYRVLKVICVGNGEEIVRQNLRTESHVGGSSKGLKGVDWKHWENRFHVEKMTMAGHSFGAATVVEVLRNSERFNNVTAGIIYDIWGAPIKPPAEDPKHRINMPLLAINSEAFMYWQSNFEAVQSLMREASEHGSPAYSITVRGSVHLSQSDFSLLYKHTISFFMKATVHPNRAIDLNISASLEFLRLVIPDTGGGKTIINRCMTDEKILETDPLDEIPEDHRPEDEYIAARLKVDNEFRKRMAAGLQRKLKRDFQGGMGTGYTTSAEVWCHFKPTSEQLKRWAEEEGKGERRIDEQSATTDHVRSEQISVSGNTATSEQEKRSSRHTEEDGADNKSHTGGSAMNSNEDLTDERVHSHEDKHISRKATAAADSSQVTSGGEAPSKTWLGLLPALKDGPQQ